MLTMQYNIIGDDIMNQYKKSSELKNAAREKLSGKYGSAMLVSPLLQGALSFVTIFPMIMMLIMVYAVIVAINLANGVENADSVESILPGFMGFYLAIIIACSFLIGILNAGIAYFYLNIACGKRHSITDIFYGFRWQFKKSLGISVITQLPSFILVMPYAVFTVLSEIDPQTHWLICANVSYAVAIIVSIPIQLMLSQCYYLLLDFPQASVKEIVTLSIRVMKGQKRRLLYLQLSFIPMELLCIFSFYIGYLWYIPYTNMTYALFFLDIMQPSVQNT